MLFLSPRTPVVDVVIFDNTKQMFFVVARTDRNNCLYAPGITTREQIAVVVNAIAPKPFNLLIGSANPLSVDDLGALGVRRISVGGALARSAWGGFIRAARMIAEQGRFDAFNDAASGKELNALFR